MKKSLLITFGILVVLIIVGVWVYLFLYGAPEKGVGIFGNFDTETVDRVPETGGNEQTEDSGVGDNITNALRQLTTRPVAGAVFTQDGVRYVERGTGHVYEIPIQGGNETLISNTTIPQTVEAFFSPTATRIVMTAQRNEKNETIVASLDLDAGEPDALEALSLPSEATNMQWNEAGSGLYYLLETSTGSAGYLYNPLTQKSTTLFEIPLRDVVVVWGNPMYVYTIPTMMQSGYVYRIDDGQLEYVTKGDLGLTALSYDNGLVITRLEAGVPRSTTLTDAQNFVVPIIPEKCTVAPHASSTMYCAAMTRVEPGGYPDAWYKGEFSFIDLLWKINVQTGESALLSHLLNASGREIDVSSIGTDSSGNYIYFINKNDGTLWLFDTTAI